MANTRDTDWDVEKRQPDEVPSFGCYDTIEERLAWALGIVSKGPHYLNDIGKDSVLYLKMSAFQHGVDDVAAVVDDHIDYIITAVPSWKPLSGWFELGSRYPDLNTQLFYHMDKETIAFRIGRSMKDYGFWSRVHVLLLRRLSFHPTVVEHYLHGFQSKSEAEAGLLQAEEPLPPNVLTARYIGWKVSSILASISQQ